MRLGLIGAPAAAFEQFMMTAFSGVSPALNSRLNTRFVETRAECV